MPSPSKTKLVISLAVSAGLLVGGAWLASQISPAEAASVDATDSGPLTLTIDGARNGQGNLLVLVWDEASAFEAYDYEAAVGYAELAASTQAQTHVFADLVDGPYAVFVFHDENGNYDFDTMSDYPLEGWAISGARHAYDEPGFAQAAIARGETGLSLTYLEM